MADPSAIRDERAREFGRLVAREFEAFWRVRPGALRFVDALASAREACRVWSQTGAQAHAATAALKCHVAAELGESLVAGLGQSGPVRDAEVPTVLGSSLPERVARAPFSTRRRLWEAVAPLVEPLRSFAGTMLRKGTGRVLEPREFVHDGKTDATGPVRFDVPIAAVSLHLRGEASRVRRDTGRTPSDNG